jgi:hypothetical protein
MKTLFAIGLAAMTATCTSYASPRLEAALGPAREPQIFGVVEGREFAKQVQAKLPAELVVAEVFASGTRRREQKDDKRTAQMLDALAEDRATFSNVEPLFTEAAACEYRDLRAAASRHHADLMLITTMSERVEGRTGAEGALNLLVLPCFVAPLMTSDLALHVRAAVVDVRNDLVYATFEDHREDRVHATAAGRTDAIDAAFDKLYADSLAKLRARVTERLRLLAAAN